MEQDEEICISENTGGAFSMTVRSPRGTRSYTCWSLSRPGSWKHGFGFAGWSGRIWVERQIDVLSPATLLLHTLYTQSSISLPNKQKAHIFNTSIRSIQLVLAHGACIGTATSVLRAHLPWEACPALPVLDHPSILGSPGRWEYAPRTCLLSFILGLLGLQWNDEPLRGQTSVLLLFRASPGYSYDKRCTIKYEKCDVNEAHR